MPFAVLVILLFAFALDPDRGVLPRVAPGLFWIAVLLAALLAIGRTFAIEQEHNARDGLRLAGLDGAAVFLGKAGAIVAELLALEVVLGAAVVLLYDVHVHGLGVLVLTAVAATVGLAATGTLYGVLAAGLRLRETLLPILLLRWWRRCCLGRPGPSRMVSKVHRATRGLGRVARGLRAAVHDHRHPRLRLIVGGAECIGIGAPLPIARSDPCGRSRVHRHRRTASDCTERPMWEEQSA